MTYGFKLLDASYEYERLLHSVKRNWLTWVGLTNQDIKNNVNFSV